MLVQIPAVLENQELSALRAALAEARFEDGMATGMPGARRAKHNLQLPENGEAARRLAPTVLDALRRHPLFFSATLPKRISGPLFNRYDAGSDYGDHFDTALIQAPALVRSDIAATLFLTSPQDYDGGELVIQDTFGAHRVKLPAGNMIVYPASSLHRVEAVTRGSRLAAVLWVESLVRDESRRRILFDLDQTIGSLAQKMPGGIEGQTLSMTYHNLLRMWAET